MGLGDPLGGGGALHELVEMRQELPGVAASFVNRDVAKVSQLEKRDGDLVDSEDLSLLFLVGRRGLLSDLGSGPVLAERDHALLALLLLVVIACRSFLHALKMFFKF